jgi:hypothetical protein
MDFTDYQPIEAPKGFIRRETDKALLIDVLTGRGDHRSVWFPKSQLALVGNVAWVKTWCLDAKAREVGGINRINRDIALAN